jgi:hypothetical protein
MRYLIIEDQKGLFLGIFNNFYLFAKNTIFPVVKVPSFNTENEAMQFIAVMSINNDDLKYGVIQVDTNDKYVSIVDIIKAGYGKYTHEMIDFLPMISETMH